jgi:hypothetical protein
MEFISNNTNHRPTDLWDLITIDEVGVAKNIYENES